MKKSLKTRILSLLLAVVMLVGVVPGTSLTSFAEEISEDGTVMEPVQPEEIATSETIEILEEAVGSEPTVTPVVNTVSTEDYGIMLMSDEGIATIAETECAVADNVIDITNRKIYKRSSSIYIDAVNINVTGGIVKSATEDGTTINIVMDGTTDSNAQLGIEFGYEAKKCKAKQDKSTIALENGKADAHITIKGYYENMESWNSSVTYTLNIESEAAGTADVENISIFRKDGGSDFSVNETQTLELKATVSPADAKSKNVIWSSLDETIATVDEKGVVKGIKEGTVTIRATSDVDSTKYSECTVTVLPIPENQLLLDITTSKGSINHVTFSDTNGNPMEFVSAELNGNTINVVLPKSTSTTAKIKAAFDLTQTGEYPFLTTKTGTSGTSSNKAVNNKFTEKVISLSEGKAVFSFYMYNQEPKTTSNVYTTYTLNFSIVNNVPQLSNNAEKSDSIVAGSEYKINVDDIFVDADGDPISYKYSTDGTNYIALEGSEYTFTHNISGEYKLYFKAYDGQNDSIDVYTVTINVKNSDVLYNTLVKVPQDITPTFYITAAKAATDGTDRITETLTAQKGETKDSFTVYTVNIPDNISRMSVRAIDSENKNWGGMCFETKDADGNVITDVATMVKVQGKFVDYGGIIIDAALNSVEYNGYKGVKGESGFLLCAEKEYTFEAVPTDTQSYVKTTLKKTITANTELFVVQIEIPYNNPFTITAPTGAKAQLYTYEKYYNSPEYTPFAIKDNGDGTSTTYFVGTSGKNSGGNLLYRVTYKDYIVKAGWATKSITVTFDENDLKANARVDYKNSTADYAKMVEDNVLLNINGQNNLVMEAGSTKTLKAYRTWEIIPVSYNNFIITPDFHYNIISGSDVVKLTDKKSLSTTDTDWKTLTAVKEGTAVIEVSYDAIQTNGYTNGWNGVYGATDPARTGLMVVQVDGHDNSVKFGIDCFASQGNMDYTKSTSKHWDAEFDTLYFTGEKGQLKFSPTAKSTIQRVQVSADKGISWTTITKENDVYTAPIAHGNNIIRVITNDGIAYQVVRGYKVDVTYKITNDNGNGIVDRGETVRVTLSDIHQPIPKMAGVYNPGYRGNYEIDGGTHIRYTFNGQTVEGNKTQYLVPTEANFIDVTIPSDTEETSFTLSGGYIATAVIGFSSFVDGGQSHRNNPDDGRPGGESTTTQHTRSMLPEITIKIGDQGAPNSAPYANADAVKAAQIELGQNFVLNPETLFTDVDKDMLAFTYTVNGIDKGATDKTFKFTPNATGDYEIIVTATDGKLSAQHTLTLRVVSATQKDTTLKFDINKSDIKGYVTVGFEDEGIRTEQSYGLKYPVKLGTIIEPVNVPFAEGDTIAEVTIRLLDAMNIGYEYTGSVTSGFYLGAIKNIVVNNTPYDSLGQFDAGEGSGWMITSNDWFIDKGASEFLVKNGDKIQWKYTCQLGADIGDNSWEKTVKVVEDLIDAIGTIVTLGSIDKITAARAAYDVLSDFYKSKVSNYTDLIVAEELLAKLIGDGSTEADKAAAKAVDDLIESIGTVTLSSAEKIEIARCAYDALNSLQKKLVEKLNILETAENQLKQLNSASHEEVYKATGNYLANLGVPAVGSSGGEWLVIGLARGNKGLSGTVTDGYFNGIVQYMDTVFSKNKILEKAVRLDESKSTDNSRVILGLTAAGIDATKVYEYNLFKGLNDMSYIKKQGINGPMWALIALNSHPDYKNEMTGNVSAEKLIAEILSTQLTDGGWDLTKTAADVDMTAMAIQALAPYYKTTPTVKDAIDKALTKLSSMQNGDGSYSATQSDGTYLPTAESTAQVIVALTSLAINPEEDARFIKKGMSTVDALCNYAVKDGGFMHTAGSGRNDMATEQGYYALVSYFRLLNGETSLYDMSDVSLKVGKINLDAPSAYDIANAKAVEKLITAIGKVTIYSNLKIEAARKAYDKLTAVQKKYVTNYETLVKAEKEYDKIVDKAVKNVEDLINDIGEVTLESADNITKARLAYNQLPDHVKKLVSNLKKLESAEKEYEKLRKEALELLAKGKLVLSKSELLKLKDKFDTVTAKTTYNDALELLLTYFALGETQQLALAGSEQLEMLKSIVAKTNHTNPSTGIGMYGLEWNIRVVTKALQKEKNDVRDNIVNKIPNSDLLTIWDIYLEDVLTNKKYTVDSVVEVCIPVELIGDYTFYGKLAVVHYMDDGRMEVLNCKVVDGYVVFNAVDFSYYAIIGLMDTEENSITDSEDVVVQTPEYEELIERAEAAAKNNNWYVWAGTGAVGIVLLAVLIVLRKRISAES